jgi:hypothetical protein
MQAQQPASRKSHRPESRVPIPLSRLEAQPGCLQRRESQDHPADHRRPVRPGQHTPVRSSDLGTVHLSGTSGKHFDFWR